MYLPEWADYLFIDSPRGDGGNLSAGLLKKLAGLANEPQQVLLPAPQLHWQWLQATEQSPVQH
jgi:hypothetical protein